MMRESLDSSPNGAAPPFSTPERVARLERDVAAGQETDGKILAALARLEKANRKLKAGEVGAMGSLGLIFERLVQGFQHPAAEGTPGSLVSLAAVLVLMYYVHRRSS
jgi:hypothetical protein